MAHTKQELANRRQAVLFGTIGGVVLYAFMHIGMPRLMGGPLPAARYSIFFGDLAGWPSFFRHCWPLDLLFSCACFILMMYVLTKSGSSTRRGDPEPDGFKEVAWMILGASLVFGSFMGLMGCCFAGWFLGIEAFVLCGLGAIVFVSAILAIVFGGSYFFLSGAAWVSGWWADSTLRQKLRPVTQPLAQVGHYLDGGDAPDDNGNPSDHPSQPKS